jgi:hypothetical protein
MAATGRRSGNACSSSNHGPPAGGTVPTALANSNRPRQQRNAAVHRANPFYPRPTAKGSTMNAAWYFPDEIVAVIQADDVHDHELAPM